MKRATINTIPLKTIHCNVSKYKSEIRPYEGFIKQTGAYIGNVLSPFYKNEVNANEADDIYVSDENIIYGLKDKKLYIQDTPVMDMGDCKFWKQEELVSPGYSIVAVLDDEELILSDYQGNVSVNGVQLPGIAYENKQVRAIAGDKDKFAFNLGNKIYICTLSGSTYTVSNYTISSPNKLSIYRNGNDFYYSTGNGVYLNGARISANVIVQKTDGTTYQSFTISGTDNGNLCLSILKNGKFVCLKPFDYSYSFVEDGITKYLYLTRGEVSVAGGVITLTANVSDCIISSAASAQNVNYFDTYLDSYTGYTSCSGKLPTTVEYVKVADTKQIPKYVKVRKWSFAKWLVTFFANQIDKSGAPDNTGFYYVDVLAGYNTVVVGYHYEPRGGQDVYLTMLITPENTYKNVCLNDSGKWIGGIANTIGRTRLLYNDGNLSSISLTSAPTVIGSLITPFGNIEGDKPINILSDTIYYNNGITWMKVSQVQKGSFTVANNRFLIINSDSYFNAYDTKEQRPFHAANDYNNRIISCHSGVPSSTPANDWNEYKAACITLNYVSGIGTNFMALNIPYCSAVWPIKQMLSKDSNLTLFGFDCETPDDIDIDVYYSVFNEDSAQALYKTSIGRYENYENYKLQGSSYVYDSNEITLNPSLFAKYYSGFINSGVIVDGINSYIQKYSENRYPLFLENLSSELRGIKSSFIIQGQAFVVIDDVIYKQLDDITEPVINISDMIYIGSTPYMAIFISTANATIYAFNGDNTLNELVQANEVNKINDIGYNPKTMDVYLLSDENLYIFSNSYLVRKPIKADRIYPTKLGFALSNDEVISSYFYQPIDIDDEDNHYHTSEEDLEIETCYYGDGDGVISVYDSCIIRLFDEKKRAGKLYLSSTTIKDTVYKSEEKEFIIKSSDWNKDGSMVIIYQPKEQDAEGLKISLRTKFKIADIKFSHEPETIINSNNKV